MPEDAEVVPVKRGPGRPRKVAPKVVAEAPPDAWKTTVDPALPLTDVDRERIDRSVHPTATEIGFDDGRRYRCADGKIVERLV